MNKYRVLIKTWFGKEPRWVTCEAETDNGARQYVHRTYGASMEILEVECVEQANVREN